MNNDTNQVRPLDTCLVIGGAGFLGSNIVKRLLNQNVKVIVFDRQRPAFDHKHLVSYQADLSDHSTLEQSCQGVDCVFHTASAIDLGGGSAAPDSYRNRSIEININGTQSVIDACHKNGVSRLVYTSSNVVCFNGTPITGMNSSTPYAQRIYDMYTESKIAAEQLVLANNGRAGLLTCAIRPSGIYGAESNMMLDKLVSECVNGKLIAALGNPNAVHENVYIDNLVHAQLLAAERLVVGNRCCGRGYFISDNEPQNNFEFFRPLIEGLGYQFPQIWIPMNLLLPLLKTWQWLHFKLGIPAPMMTPKELDKACTTHLSDISEPLKDLDYQPLITVSQAMEICLPYCLDLQKRLTSATAKGLNIEGKSL